jgi:hypothetical protein
MHVGQAAEPLGVALDDSASRSASTLAGMSTE